MTVLRRVFALGLVCLASLGAAQRADQQAAERILGPRWRQIARSAGAIFSGTVLNVETQRAVQKRPISLILIRFRVDRAVAGVRTGEVLTIREWAGAWSTHRAMRRGQHFFIFLYPPSRLDLTSPVGGSVGQIELDSRGEIVSLPAAKADLELNPFSARLKSCPPEILNDLGRLPSAGAFPRTHCEDSIVPPAAAPSVTLRQVERAIREVRDHASEAWARGKE